MVALVSNNNRAIPDYKYHKGNGGSCVGPEEGKQGCEVGQKRLYCIEDIGGDWILSCRVKIWGPS